MLKDHVKTKILTVFLFAYFIFSVVAVFVPKVFAADWTTPDAVHSKNGETAPNVATNAIDDSTSSYWRYDIAVYHWIIFDMGETKIVTKIQIYQSGLAAYRWGLDQGLYVYVSDDPAAFGDAVWEGVLNAVGWQESGAFNKNGRYVKLKSKSSDAGQHLNEFQAYAEIVPPEPGVTHFLFETGGSLGFQNDIGKTVVLQIISGILNSTTNAFSLDAGGGYFRFTALNDTEITIVFVGVDYVQVSGDQNNGNRHIQSGETITINSGNNVVISWTMLIKPWLPLLFIIGIIGLFASFGGPLYAINKIKHHEYYEGIRTGLVLTVTGIAFVIAWLW